MSYFSPLGTCYGGSTPCSGPGAIFSELAGAKPSQWILLKNPVRHLLVYTAYNDSTTKQATPYPNVFMSVGCKAGGCAGSGGISCDLSTGGCTGCQTDADCAVVGGNHCKIDQTCVSCNGFAECGECGGGQGLFLDECVSGCPSGFENQNRVCKGKTLLIH
jgi:hypothetical protein